MAVLETLWDALKDSLVIFPFLLVVYVIIELLEGRADGKLKKVLQSKAAPLYGGIAGVIPQCGFSVMCSNLYRRGIIALGTLFAVFLSTSDEGVILLLTERKFIPALVLIGIKVVYAFIIGFLINLIFRKKTVAVTPIKEEEHLEHDHHEHGEHHHEHEDGLCCGKDHHGNKLEKYLLHPLYHSLQVFAFVLAVNIVFGFLVYFIGEGNVKDFLIANKYLQPVLSSLVGLIPNCAASVIIAESYAGGFLTFGALVSGLMANAGLGVAVLFKDGSKLKENLIILLSMYLLSVPIGYIAMFIPIG